MRKKLPPKGKRQAVYSWWSVRSWLWRERSYWAHNFYFMAHWMYLVSSRVMNFNCYVSLDACKTASSISKIIFEKWCEGFP